MKKTILLVLIALVTMGAKAYDFSVDGVYYNVIDKSGKMVEVTKGDAKYSGSVTIPATVSNDGVTYTVARIGSEAFRECTNLESVTLGSKVETIDYCAFYNCSSLSEINLNDQIVSYGAYAFQNCTSLTSVVIGSKVDEMGGAVFDGCINIKTVEIHEGASVIGKSAFSGCTKLTTITIPNSVLTIGDGAFYGCVSLTEAKIGNGVKTIPSEAFRECTNLESVTLGSKVETIDYCAFYNCSSLSEINLNDQIVSYGAYAFQNCTSLTSVVIGSKVDEMGGAVFDGCINIKTVEIHEGASVIGKSAFSGCTKLTTITIPNSMLTIGDGAFYGCVSLTEAKIGDSVQTISSEAFRGCARLSTVTLGSSVKTVGYCTFYDCNNMTSFTVLNPEPPAVENYAFTDYSAKLYVPSQSTSSYNSHEIWKKFGAVKDYDSKVYLTIRQATEGAVKMLTNVGERYSYDIIPASGWEIHSVTFNNEDVTKQLVGNNYTTPAMTSNGTLSIVFVEEGSGVRSATARDVRVTTDDSGNIIVNEAPYGETISVYSTNGILLRQVPADGGRTSINMNAHGIYIVKVGDMTAKLSL